MFMGSLLLFAAVIAWALALLMSPHGSSVAEGTEHVRTVVVTYVRNTAVGTLVLAALSGWLLFPQRRPNKPRRDWAIAVLLAVLVATSIYQLIWTRSLLS
jgi:drug/metabolite transporter (DMT)-like permease